MSLIADLESKLSSAEASASASIMAFFSSALADLAHDEIVILGNAINRVITERKGGADWETAFTAALNEFYSAETEEINTLATSLLEAISKVLAGVEEII